MSGLLLPVNGYTGMSTWQNHINRGTPSSEPGTDLYVPIGTPVYAPADGTIWGNGTSIAPATGRWVGINFDNGMSFRALHLSRLVRGSGRVSAGDLIAYSGATGYGEEDWSWNVAETGGAHTHVTLWPTWDHLYGYKSKGVPWTIDFMNYVGGSAAGAGNNASSKRGFLMALSDAQEGHVYDALMAPGGAYAKTDAIINIQRGEEIPRLDGIVARTDATNTTLGAIIEMLKELDPSKSADIAAFEVKLRESEARTIAATAAAIQGSTVAIRAEIVTAIAGIEGSTLDPGVITDAVDKALDRVFVRAV